MAASVFHYCYYRRWPSANCYGVKIKHTHASNFMRRQRPHIEVYLYVTSTVNQSMRSSGGLTNFPRHHVMHLRESSINRTRASAWNFIRLLWQLIAHTRSHNDGYRTMKPTAECFHIFICVLVTNPQRFILIHSSSIFTRVIVISLHPSHLSCSRRLPLDARVLCRRTTQISSTIT